VRSDADEVGVEGLRRLADRFDDMGIFNDANLGVDGGNAGIVGDLRAQLFCALGDMPGAFGRSRRFADMGNAHGAVLIDKATMMAAVGSPTAVDIYGVRARARGWCNFSGITGSVAGIAPVAVFDLGSSRLMVENTRTGVLA
jgi:hypothetical protein